VTRRLTTSIRVNNDVTVAEFVDLAQLAEALGFDQIWVSNDLFLRSAPVLIAAAVVATSRIAIGTCIVNPFSIHPAELAMTAATLQELSGGRFLLGIAAGAEDFLSWAGIEQRRPLTVTREAILAIRALTEGRSPVDVEGSGAGWTVDARLRTPSHPTPIYLGAMSPRMLTMIGEIADGGLPLLYPPESFVEARRYVDAGLVSADRDRSAVDLAACIWVSIDEDRQRARQPLAAKLAYFAPSFSPYVLERAGIDPSAVAALRGIDMNRAGEIVPEALMALGIAGTPDEVVERCQGLVGLGVSHLSFGPPLGPDRQHALRLLADHVLPALC